MRGHDGLPDGINLDDKELVRIRAIIQSMTRFERADPYVLIREPTRASRIANGSGTDEKQVSTVVQQFLFMKQMMGSIGSQAGMLGKIPGMKQLAAANRLRDAVKTGGFEGNPMMGNLAEELLQAAVAEQGGFGPGGMTQAPKRTVNKGKKKSKRKMQKKSRRKSRR